MPVDFLIGTEHEASRVVEAYPDENGEVVVTVPDLVAIDGPEDIIASVVDAEAADEDALIAQSVKVGSEEGDDEDLTDNDVTVALYNVADGTSAAALEDGEEVDGIELAVNARGY